MVSGGMDASVNGSGNIIPCIVQKVPRIYTVHIIFFHFGHKRTFFESKKGC